MGREVVAICDTNSMHILAHLGKTKSPKSHKKWLAVQEVKNLFLLFLSVN